MYLYPSLKQVEEADQMTLCRWYRFLSSPDTDERMAILNRIIECWSAGGGFTSELSKAIGWDF